MLIEIQMGENMKVIFFLCLCFINQSWAAVIPLDEIETIDVVVSEEREVCFWGNLEHSAPCSPGSKKGVQKAAQAFLVLKDNSRHLLGNSNPGRIGHLEHVDFKRPLSNLLVELNKIIDNREIYFNQYNLCYRLGVESNKLTEDARAFGTYFHLSISRLYVDCDAHSIPAMVFVKD